MHMKFKLIFVLIILSLFINVDSATAAVKKTTTYKRPRLNAYLVKNKKQPVEEVVTAADKAKIVYSEDRVKEIVIESKNGTPIKLTLKKEKGVIEYVVTTDKAIVKVDAITGKILNTISFQVPGKPVPAPIATTTKKTTTKVVPTKTVKPVVVTKKAITPIKKK